MNEFTRITVALSKEEFFALRDTAFKEYRHPREQARHLLRGILLGDQPTKEKSSVQDSTVNHAAFVQPCQPCPVN